jgi:hypothetical protein
MSRSKKGGKSPGWEFSKPGPLSWKGRGHDDKKAESRIKRHWAKEAVRKTLGTLTHIIWRDRYFVMEDDNER